LRSLIAQGWETTNLNKTFAQHTALQQLIEDEGPLVRSNHGGTSGAPSLRSLIAQGWETTNLNKTFAQHTALQQLIEDEGPLARSNHGELRVPHPCAVSSRKGGKPRI